MTQDRSTISILYDVFGRIDVTTDNLTPEALEFSCWDVASASNIVILQCFFSPPPEDHSSTIGGLNGKTGEFTTRGISIYIAMAEEEFL